MLRIAAREADIVGINGTLSAGEFGDAAFATMTLDAVTDKVDIVADAAGERTGDIELNIRTFFNKVTDDRRAAVGRIARAVGIDEAMLETSPFALIGSHSGIVEDLLALRERFGFSYVIVGANEIESFAPVVAQLAGH